MNVLITGGCGFVGANLTKYLSEKGYAIRILDNLSTGKREYVELPSLPKSPELIVGDIRNKETISRALDGIDAVVHLAAHCDVVESVENPSEDWEINASGTFNVLESSRLANVDRFIFASSNAVTGEQPPPINEMMIPQPRSPYGASKLAGEALCLTYFHSFGLKTTALRFANVYGPLATHKSSVISKFLQWAKEGTPFTVYGDGNQTRDFVHINDICQAIHLALTSANAAGEIFQIASGTETSVNELVRIINNVTGKHIPANYEPERTGEIRRNYSDISKAIRLLGFEPTVRLEDGLKNLWTG